MKTAEQLAEKCFERYHEFLPSNTPRHAEYFLPAVQHYMEEYAEQFRSSPDLGLRDKIAIRRFDYWYSYWEKYEARTERDAAFRAYRDADVFLKVREEQGQALTEPRGQLEHKIATMTHAIKRAMEEIGYRNHSSGFKYPDILDILGDAIK